MLLANLWNRVRGRRALAGIHPPAQKAAALRSRIMPMPLPERFVLPLSSPHGGRSEPVVKVGDQVLKFEMVARTEDPAGLNIHAPSSGHISAIEIRSYPGPKQLIQGPCLILDCDGLDRPAELPAQSDYHRLDDAQLLDRLQTAGIRGLGGGQFPTAEKLRQGRQHNVRLLIINGIECEPWISADQALLRERAAAVLEGATILQTALAADRCVLAVSGARLDSRQTLLEAAHDSEVELQFLSARYPLGSEAQLVQALTDVEVPSGKLPLDIGVLVQNVGTAYAAYRAIEYGEPCIGRVTTLAGAALRTPKNFEVLFGTPVTHLLNLCGCDWSQLQAVLIGGPLSGYSMGDWDVPVTGACNSLVTMTEQEFPPAAAERPCIRCGRCADVCPAYLLPQSLYAGARAEDSERLLESGLPDCIECGACAYVCPSHIPLLQYFRAGKDKLAIESSSTAQRQHWQQRFITNQRRLQQAREETANRQAARPRTADRENDGFDRANAQNEIAAAVARVQARKRKARKKS